MSAILERILEDNKGPPSELLVCEICGYALADAASKMIVMGIHSHQLSTQQGQSLRFDCYSEAPGISVEGSSKKEHTPFPKYKCQPAFCAQCEEQMGWFFEGPRPFYGLLADRTERIRREDRE